VALSESHPSEPSAVLETTIPFPAVASADPNAADRAGLFDHIDQEQAMLSAVLASISDGLVVIDSAERIRYCNTPAAQFLGIESHDIIGQTVGEAFGRVSRSVFNRTEAREAWDRALATLDEHPSFEVMIGEPVPRELVVQFFPLKPGDGPRSAGILMHDVSALKLVALLEERERIAMDLHDGVIQSLYAVGLGLAARERALGNDVEQAHEVLRHAMAQINVVIQEIRDYIGKLRPVDLGEHGLLAGLAELAGQLRANGLLCPELDLDPAAGALVTADAAANLLYIAHEAISNVIRHADASAASIRVSAQDGRLVLTIQDDGHGFNPERTGRRTGDGLRNMAERARALNARLNITSAPGRGTRLNLEMPLPPQEEQR